MHVQNLFHSLLYGSHKHGPDIIAVSQLVRYRLLEIAHLLPSVLSLRLRIIVIAKSSI